MKKGFLAVLAIAAILTISASVVLAGEVPLFLYGSKGLLSYDQRPSEADIAEEKIKQMIFPNVAEVRRKEWDGLVIWLVLYRNFVYVLVCENVDELDESRIIHDLAREKGFQSIATIKKSDDDFLAFAAQKELPLISSVTAIGNLELNWEIFGIPLPEPKPGPVGGAPYTEPKKKQSSTTSSSSN